MIRRPPRATRTDTLFPYTTLFRSEEVGSQRLCEGPQGAVPPLRLLPDATGLWGEEPAGREVPGNLAFLLSRGAQPVRRAVRARRTSGSEAAGAVWRGRARGDRFAGGPRAGGDRRGGRRGAGGGGG